MLILSLHHCLTDGIGVFQILCACNQEPDVNDLMMMKPLPFLKKTVIYCLLPFITLIEASRVLLFSFKEKNLLKRNLPNESDYRIAAINMDLKSSLPDMKKAAKTTGISLNDLCISILSNTIHEYVQRYKHETPEY